MPVQVLCPRDEAEALVALERVRRLDAPRRGVIARGMGRAYNDAAQRSGGMVLDTTAMTAFELDGERGTVTAQAGVTLRELLATLVPRGWIVPVVPGTQHVTVGGAIAGDIHGKNHSTVGSFGAHTEAITLLSSAGEVRELAAGDEAFAATLGGMGLTGLILRARLRLRPVRSALVAVDTDRVEDLDAALASLQAPGGSHRVAWLDLLGNGLARGIVTRAEHVEAPNASAGAAVVRARGTVPSAWPGGILTPGTVRAFNDLRFRAAPRRRRGHLEEFGSHMFPLDVLGAWPRLYGPRGFLQYQLVVPYGREDALQAVIERLRRSSTPCYLAVLKDFGAAGVGHLSFPIPGWTLTLDIPRAARELDSLLTGFDELVAGAGGRVYLCKDPRVGAVTLRAMYPRVSEWQAVRDRLDPERLWRSDLSLRTGLVP